ncbi:MAG TPA: Fis family transcriptional regulator [Peptococcaceae bacterium]|nr:Fis family transcriptional regulator [Peptococcaceae bacterium]
MAAEPSDKFNIDIINDLRLQNKMLLLWQEEFKAVLDAISEGIEVVDMSGQVTYVNRSFETILDEPASERIGKNIFDVSSNGALVETLRTNAPVHGKIHPTLNGKKVVLANSSPIKVSGKMQGAVSVFMDISKVENMSRQLENRNKEIQMLKEQVLQYAAPQYTLNSIIGKSEAIKQCLKMAQKIADTNLTVLISGESGTGKELFAHGIHSASRRANGPFVKINCAAIPDHLLESEFFGFEAGAFTGATKSKMGKFELAHTGTLFLDEIGEMSIILQAKLLRVLQDKEVERLGAVKPRKVDVRIIVATNKDLAAEVEKGNFRQDLYYRLNVINLAIPPLRERPEDIVVIAQHIISRLNEEYSSQFILTDEIIAELKAKSWPGNVRELENYLGKRVLFDQDEVSEIGFETTLQTKTTQKEALGTSRTEGFTSLEDNEKQLIRNVLEKYGYDLQGKQRAAKELKISLSTLYNKLRRYKGDGKQ